MTFTTGGMKRCHVFDLFLAIQVFELFLAGRLIDCVLVGKVPEQDRIDLGVSGWGCKRGKPTSQEGGHRQCECQRLKTSIVLLSQQIPAQARGVRACRKPEPYSHLDPLGAWPVGAVAPVSAQCKSKGQYADGDSDAPRPKVPEWQ